MSQDAGVRESRMMPKGSALGSPYCICKIKKILITRQVSSAAVAIVPQLFSFLKGGGIWILL